MDGQARFPRQRTDSGSWRRADPRPRAAPGEALGYPLPGSGPIGRSAPGRAADPADPGLRGTPAPGCALHRRLHLGLDAADLVAVSAVRHRLRVALEQWGVPELADTAELLTSEVVTNALLHTTHGAVFEAVLTADLRLRIEVQDGMARLPGRHREPVAEYATSGRGLLLVEALADDWGVQLRGGGKVTWFELAYS